MELSDEFMLAEERKLNRARRNPKSIDRYDEVQAQEEAKKWVDEEELQEGSSQKK